MDHHVVITIRRRDSIIGGFLALIFVPLGWMFIAAVVALAFAWQVLKLAVKYTTRPWWFYLYDTRPPRS